MGTSTPPRAAPRVDRSKIAEHRGRIAKTPGDATSGAIVCCWAGIEIELERATELVAKKPVIGR
jgi:hypothetical protein